MQASGDGGRELARPQHKIDASPDAAPPPPVLKLRPLQRAILKDSNRFKVACIHRRFGKTVLAIEYLKKAMEACEYPDPRGYFVFPFAKQGEEIAWDFLQAQTASIEGMTYDKWRLEANFPGGARIKLLGAATYQKHRGKYADAVAFDECPDIAPSAWKLVFRPMLSDREGSALFIATPRGHDWFYDLWQNGGRLQDWAAWHATVYETSSVKKSEIEALRREMSEEEFAQEYLCDWDVARLGAFYQRQVNTLISDGRHCDVPHNPGELVKTAWWIDRTDQLTVTYWQHAGPMLHCIDVSHETGGSVAEMVREVRDKPYIYDQHFYPDTIAPDSERVKVARRLGVQLSRVTMPATMDGIERVKNMLARVRIDREKGDDLVEAGRQYHATFDEKRRAFNQEPVRDWSAEYCGSLAVFMNGYNARRSDWNAPIIYPEQFRA